jgi:pilus assembly protein CpaE
MSSKSEVLLLGVGPELEAAISTALAGIARVSQSIFEYERCADLTNGVPDQIVLVDVDTDVEAGYRAVSALSCAHPIRPVVVLSRSNEGDQVLRAMRSGARDYALITPDLSDVVRAAGALTRAAGAASNGKVISVFAAKGGSGATTLATNLAGSLRQRHDLGVVLLDLDLEMGDTMLFLDLQARYSIADAIRNLERLDQDLLAEVVAIHASSKVHVLSQSSNVEEADQITPERAAKLIQVLRRAYDLVVVDGLQGFDALTLAALDASDQILLVLTQDVPAIKNARRCLQIFERIGYSGDRIRVVLNRFQARHELDLASIAETIGHPIDACVANDFKTTIEAVNRGLLLSESAPRARVTADLARLGDQSLGRELEAESKRGVLASLFSARR